jgi:peptidyl-prolyl cis-trans isomerase A (cyclophilin A)
LHALHRQLPKNALRLLTWLLAACFLAPLAARATMVRLYTTLGPVDIQLLDNEAPATVANFLGYVHRRDYDNSFIHRSIPGFIVQGGGYTWTDGAGLAAVPAQSAVINEFSVERSNLRGTVAMAKIGANPPTPASINSATNQWFINLANNAGNLDNQNGGFTVFGRVTAPGMVVVDAMAALQVFNAQGAFTNLPLVSKPVSTIKRANLLMVDSVVELPTPATNADRLFNYVEAAFASLLKPPGTTSATASAGGTDYYFRYYPASNSFVAVGVADNVFYYLVPAAGNDVVRVAPLPELMGLVMQSGY